MTRADPFTVASPTYQSAMRHPFKSGAAMEVLGRGFPINLARFGLMALQAAACAAPVALLIKWAL